MSDLPVLAWLGIAVIWWCGFWSIVFILSRPKQRRCKDCKKEKRCQQLADRKVGLQVYVDCDAFTGGVFRNYTRKFWAIGRAK